MGWFTNEKRGQTRRDFLRALALGVVGAAVVDPERLIWTPGAKTHILPPAGGWKRFVGFDPAFGPDRTVIFAQYPGEPTWIQRKFVEPEKLVNYMPYEGVRPPFEPIHLTERYLVDDEHLHMRFTKEQLAKAVKALADEIDKQALQVYMNAYMPKDTIALVSPRQQPVILTGLS